MKLGDYLYLAEIEFNYLLGRLGVEEPRRGLQAFLLTTRLADRCRELQTLWDAR